MRDAQVAAPTEDCRNEYWLPQDAWRPRESRDPAAFVERHWVPAFAGTTIFRMQALRIFGILDEPVVFVSFVRGSEIQAIVNDDACLRS